MLNKKMLLCTIANPVIVFPLAIVWHLVLFKDRYDQLGYIAREEPIFAFGFLSMLIQGFLLAYILPFFLNQYSAKKGLIICFSVMWLYSWTFHVLAAAAKQPLEPLSTWFIIETAYLLIHFGLVGLAFGWIHGCFHANK